MSSETIPELQGELAALFDLGKLILGSVLIEHGQTTYLFEDDGEGVLRFLEESGVSHKLVAATRGHHEAQEETLWCAALEASDFETAPYLYELHSSLPIVELRNVAKKNHRGHVRLVVTDGTPRPQISSLEKFEPWDHQPNRDFFKHRGLTSGRYSCNSMQQVTLDLMARPQDYEDFDIQSMDTYGHNELVFDAGLGGFVMELNLCQKLKDSPSELITVLARIQRFLFYELDMFLARKSSASFAEYFAEKLALKEYPLLKKRLDEVSFNPFVDDDDRFGSHSEWWFTPVAVRFHVEKLELDPSFGTVTRGASKKFDLLELRENWLKTNFENINANDYLRRLVQQAQQFPE